MKDNDWREHVLSQICDITARTFEAAARNMGAHFEPLSNAFEIFGVDFLVDEKGKAWLLEVNAFPDFKQTGEKLVRIVIGKSVPSDEDKHMGLRCCACPSCRFFFLRYARTLLPVALQMDVVAGLMESVVDVAVRPFFGLETVQDVEKRSGGMLRVLDIDLRKR